MRVAAIQNQPIASSLYRNRCYSAVWYFVFCVDYAPFCKTRRVSEVSAKRAMTYGDVRYSRLCLVFVESSNLFYESVRPIIDLHIHFRIRYEMFIATLVFNCEVALTKVFGHKFLVLNCLYKKFSNWVPFWVELPLQPLAG